MSDLAMGKIPYLEQRGGRWYFRMRVPDDVANAFGKTEIRKSLNTGCYKTARQLREEELRIADRAFEKLRAIHNDNLAHYMSPPTVREIDQWVKVWLTQRRVECDDKHSELVKNNLNLSDAPEDYDNGLGDLERRYHQLCDDPDRLDTGIKNISNIILGENGFTRRYKYTGTIKRELREPPIDPQSEEYQYLQRKVSDAWLSLTRYELSYYQRSETIANLSAPALRPSAETLTLDDLIVEFTDEELKRRGLREKAERDYEATFRVLREVISGDTPITEIDKAGCRTFRDLVEKIPPNYMKKFPGMTAVQAADKATEEGLPTLGASTVKGYITRISSMFNYAVDEDYIVKNPATRLVQNYKGHSKADRFPFDEADLQKLFSAPIYTGCENDKSAWRKPGHNRPKGTRYWIPLIALHQGFRLNEICQLYVDDIIKKDGILGFHINDDSEDKRQKTDASRRIVPVHPFLLELGFAEYVSERVKAGDERLFPDLKQDSRGYYSDAFQKWFKRFQEECGVIRDRKSFHSFRHTFKDAAVEAGLPEDLIAEVGGWSEKNTSQARYGAGRKLRTLYESISKIEFSGVSTLT